MDIKRMIVRIVTAFGTVAALALAGGAHFKVT
jgi:hypothetical protein